MAEPPAAPGLTHLDEAGAARMVDVGGKAPSARLAIASGRIAMSPEAAAAIAAGAVAKGDVLAVARVAGIMAAKRTSELIPLCHPLPITRIAVDFSIDEAATAIECRATVETRGQTGVEMEALTAVQIGLLTIYDMCKAVDRGMVIVNVRLLEKRGGKSGDYVAA